MGPSTCEVQNRMLDVLEVSARESLGKLNSRRLRAEGIVPAVLYGHGEASVSLKLPVDQLRASLRHGAHVVELKGAAKGQALLQDVQWDTFQQHILHVDLLRVDAKELVKVEVPIVLRGQAPGGKRRWGGGDSAAFHRDRNHCCQRTRESAFEY